MTHQSTPPLYIEREEQPAPRCRAFRAFSDCVARLENRVDQLPGRRGRAPVRRKRIAMLVVISRGEVLLEKRPSRGIWGGLWSLPEADVGDPPRDALARDWGLDALEVEARDGAPSARPNSNQQPNSGEFSLLIGICAGIQNIPCVHYIHNIPCIQRIVFSNRHINHHFIVDPKRVCF